MINKEITHYKTLEEVLVLLGTENIFFSQSLSTPKLNKYNSRPVTDAHNLRKGDRNTNSTKSLPTDIGNIFNTNNPDDIIYLFLKWNTEVLVSEIERKKNKYHCNRSNTFAQGNGNPFKDNPRLASKIWGVANAKYKWWIYPDSNTELQTKPSNMTTNNTYNFSTNLSWHTSAVNVAVTGFNDSVNNQLFVNTTSNKNVL